MEDLGKDNKYITQLADPGVKSLFLIFRSFSSLLMGKQRASRALTNWSEPAQAFPYTSTHLVLKRLHDELHVALSVRKHRRRHLHLFAAGHPPGALKAP